MEEGRSAASLRMRTTNIVAVIRCAKVNLSVADGATRVSPDAPSFYLSRNESR